MKIVLVWNIIVFLLYGLDKWKAIIGKTRIKERTLLAWAFLLGGFGSFFGMYVFRHKTNKRIFVIYVPIAVIINIIIIHFFGKYFP